MTGKNQEVRSSAMEHAASISQHQSSRIGSYDETNMEKENMKYTCNCS